MSSCPMCKTKNNLKCSGKNISKQKNKQNISQNFIKNYSVSELKNQLSDYMNEHVYFYKMTSVTKKGNELSQAGTAPNFEGGVATLCTCKHYMRTFSIIKNEQCWLIGFSDEQNGENLFYIARIEKTFESYFELWRILNEKGKKEKCATTNCLGDIYEPKNKNVCIAPLSAKSYEPPMENHSHGDFESWAFDVGETKYKKAPRYIKFDPEKTFLWKKAKITYVHRNDVGDNHYNLKKFAQGQRSTRLGDILDNILKDI